MLETATSVDVFDECGSIIDAINAIDEQKDDPAPLL